MIKVEEIISNYDNSICYYIEGTRTLHREDGPALIDDTSTEWFFNGNLHREDGPAVIHREGDVEWWLNGNYFYRKETWFEALTEEQKIKALYSEYFIEG